MTKITATVTRCFESGVTDVELAGELDLDTASTVRAVVRKCLADQPTAVLIDVNRLVVASRSAARVFGALEDQQDREIHVPVLLYARSGSGTADPVRGAVGRFVPLCDDRPAALRALAQGSARRRDHLYLPAVPASAAASRAFTRDFCERTGLDHLADAAQIVVNELVTNAIRHSGTEASLTLACGRTHLAISVRDRLPVPPRLSVDHAGADAATRTARGLALVDRLSAGWGTFIRPDGKTVWANLRIRPLRPDPA